MDRSAQRALLTALALATLVVPPAASAQRASRVQNARAHNANTGGRSGVVRVGRSYEHAGLRRSTLTVAVENGTPKDRPPPRGTWYQSGKLVHMTPRGVREAPWHLQFEARHPELVPATKPGGMALYQMRLRSASYAQKYEALVKDYSQASRSKDGARAKAIVTELDALHQQAQSARATLLKFVDPTHKEWQREPARFAAPR